MAHVTEAACLLQSGALYTRRIGLRRESGAVVFAGFKHGAFSVYFDDEPIYHFDLEGRWQRAFLGGVHFLKALDTHVEALERIREGTSLVLHRRQLPFAEASDLDASVRQMALDLLGNLAAGQFATIPPESAAPLELNDLREILDQVAHWDAAAWFAHRERYLATYGPLGFLPPDSPQSVILQATLGHADRLAFGHGETAEHYVRSRPEFAEHAREVHALYGKRSRQCRSVLLGGSDVLRQPESEVIAYLEELAQVFPIDRSASRARLSDMPAETPRLAGVSAFLDRFEPPLPEPRAWACFHELGLARVTLCVESGDVPTRRLYGRHWPNEALPLLVSQLKAAGVDVSVILLAGAGGREHAEAHVAASAALLLSLPLGPGDLVYIIPSEQVGKATASRWLSEQGLTPLTAAAEAGQQKTLLDELAPLRRERKAKVVPYSTEKQWT